MKRKLEKFIFLLNAEYPLDSLHKERFILSFLCTVHCILLLLFLLLEVWIMVACNVISVAVYLIARNPKLYTNYKALLVTMCTEVMFHMLLAVICVGWDSSFYLYIAALIPAAYFLSYTARSVQRKSLRAWVVTFVACALFVCARIYCFYIAPIYELSDTINFTLAIGNGICFFGILIYFFTLFTTAVNSSEHILRTNNRKLSTLANTDPLTQLYNRRGMQEQLDSAILDAEVNGRIFSVIIGDVDDFKKLNDTYGHECGDFVLVRIAEIVKIQIRSMDFICRWGGEEILILLNGCAIDKAETVAEKLRKSVEEAAIDYGEHRIEFTMTFGVQEYIAGSTVDGLIKAADEKLYYGKQIGKNRVVSKLLQDEVNESNNVVSQIDTNTKNVIQ